jgi:hypothetical protein
VIRLALRLSLGGGREAAVRLIVMAAAVALGAALLLISLAGINAVNTQNVRSGWLNTVSAPARPDGSESGSGSAPGAARGSAGQPLWWLLRADYYHDQLIGRLDVAATGPRSPVPPGLAHLPGPGQFYASPALSKLLRSVPAGQLGDRYPGRQVGTIGPAGLPAPTSLLIVIGHTAGQLARQPGAGLVASIRSGPLSGCSGASCSIGVGIDANGIDLILSVVGVGLLLPVLIFIAAATRLSAARREQRFAAMRLAGATPRQVSVISAVESAVAAIAGAVLGFGLFFALRPVIAPFPFSGQPFFTSDLSLSLADVAVVAIGVPVAAAVVARLALRRVQISPLGVSRRVTPAAPRAWRLIPLLVGIGELAVFVPIGGRRTTPGQIEAFLPGFLLILAGLMIAGPWLTMAGARVMARRARRPAALIAARRLTDNPRAGFRAISGLVLALFVTTVILGVITTLAADRGAPRGAIGTNVLADQLSQPPGSGPVARVGGTLLTRLRAIPGVQGVIVIHTNPLGTKLRFPGWGSNPTGLVSCAQLARTPVLGRCPAGALAAALPPQVFSPVLERNSAPQARTVWPAAQISARRLARLPVQTIAIGTTGSAAAIERARTLLQLAYPGPGSPVTLRETYLRNDLTKWEQLADVIILASLVIAGCTMAVSAAAGLSERKRPFSLLRLTGAPLSVLRGVVALESAVPLLLVAVVSTGIGLVAAQLYLTTQLHYSLQPPGAGYYVVVLGGLGASLAVIAATLPVLRRITGPATARNE